MNLVPHHSLSVLTGACAGRDRRQMDCIGQVLDGHNQLGDYHIDRIAADLLFDEKRETPVPSPDGVHRSKPADKRVRYRKHVRHIYTLAHAHPLHIAPRDLSLAAQFGVGASASIYGYHPATPIDLTKVNETGTFVRVAA